ncbi:MAG: hypothetical protein NC122_07425 [Faecalibacterium sp.]|nr:hypothetical protein [Ruminococcus sp.]MCM1392174.1 hypothetical protein [Ruminococcus sp.]MCM1486022.1 hypothetical protein [Faecalibacterium sp.]
MEVKVLDRERDEHRHLQMLQSCKNALEENLQTLKQYQDKYQDALSTENSEAIEQYRKKVKWYEEMIKVNETEIKNIKEYLKVNYS